MTAVVGILNRQAVAIAADSAVSINGRVLNSAMKIFTLSKYHPIGVMIYNNASFLTTPWETIIKLYRNNLKDKALNTVEDYQKDFIKFLHTEKFFTDEATSKEVAKYLIIHRVLKDSLNNAERDEKNSAANPKPSLVTFLESEIDKTLGLVINLKICSEFQAYTQNDFDNYFGQSLDESIQNIYNSKGLTITAQLRTKINELIYKIIKVEESYIPFTGLVFVGYGEKEIYPSLIPINITTCIADKLKYLVGQKTSITHNFHSNIVPFAETDTMLTLLTGISPKLQETYLENFKQYVEKYNSLIVNTLTPSVQNINTLIGTINTQTLIEEFKKQIQETKETNYVTPLLEAVASLSKKDLAEMAESLIYLTFLQKRINLAVENVGGEVDVAVISKGDGFIWIKRKHYFKPELNQHFFSNYFK